MPASQGGKPALTTQAAPTAFGAGKILRSYEQWVAEYDTLYDDRSRQVKSALAELRDPPLVSILMPVYNTPADYLRQAIDSIRRQIYTNWELCIVDDASSSKWVGPLIAAYESEDTRVRSVRNPTNEHITGATNRALTLARGTWVAFCDHDDVLPEHALAEAALAIDSRPDAGLLYSDEDKIDGSGRRWSPYFKPDWDPILILGQNYLAHLFMARRDLVDTVGGMRAGYDGSQDWDLALRVSELLRSEQIVHVPQVLYHWRCHPDSTAAAMGAKRYARTAAKHAVSDHLARTGRRGEVIPVGMTGYQRVRWQLPERPPEVSVVVATRTGRHLKRCLESIFQLTGYYGFEVVLLDNGISDVALLQYLLDRSSDLVYLRNDCVLSRAEQYNEAARHAQGEVLCLVADDVEVLSPQWLEEMVGLLIQPHIAAVGAKLLDPAGHVLHTGLILGIGGIAGSGFLQWHRLDWAYFGQAALAQAPSAVSGACMAVRGHAWKDLGGFNSVNVPELYHDVDFCLRLGENRWRVGWTPFAELVRNDPSAVDSGAESRVSRAERRWMRAQWGALLDNDPAYNPNLTLGDGSHAVAWPPRTGRTDAATSHHGPCG